GCVGRPLVIGSQGPRTAPGRVACYPMAPAPIPGPSANVAAAGLASVGVWRLLAVSAPHLAALAIMLQTETDLGSRIGFLLAWGILNLFWITLLRRPALSGALSLTLVIVLILLSRLKHDIVQMTVNFVDIMMIDRDTAAFLFTIFPNLRWSVIGAGFVVVPLVYALWRVDPFRIRRLPALACKLACLAALVGYFVTRIASGRVERGLPLALRRCGYNTTSLYPAYGAFMSARGFQTSTGIQRFYDSRDLGTKQIEPDSFFYDKAMGLMAQEPPATPQFMFIYLAANHFPWE